MTQVIPTTSAGSEKHPWAVTRAKVDDVVDRLVAAASPLRLIVFGSAAQGDLASANDLDLLVVKPDLTSRYAETVRLQKALRGVLGFPRFRAQVSGLRRSEFSGRDELLFVDNRTEVTDR